MTTFTGLIKPTLAKIGLNAGYVLTDKWLSNTHWLIARYGLNEVLIEQIKEKSKATYPQLTDEQIESIFSNQADYKRTNIDYSRLYLVNDVRVKTENGVSFNAYYIAFIHKWFQRITSKLEFYEKDSASPLLVKMGDEIIGAVMPLRE